MVTIGDVFSIVGALVGICVTAWALIMATSLLFQSSASRARDIYRSAPWKGFGLGFVLSLVLFVGTIALTRMPIPGFKLLGTGLLLILMALSALGISGICLVVAERVAALDPNISRFGAMQKAAAILVVAGVFPILGWFLAGPALVIAGVGYGAQALLKSVLSLATPPIQRM